MTDFVGHGRDVVTPADELVAVEDHLAAILDLVPPAEPIALRLVDALGLVLAEDVASEVQLPAFPNSAMDGYAVVAASLAGASPETPVITTSWSRGMETVMFLRLCSRAPVTTMRSVGIRTSGSRGGFVGRGGRFRRS
ncbi:MAG: hypothetical protein WD011_05130 [Nitriliruptoraceae bacterium]